MKKLLLTLLAFVTFCSLQAQYYYVPYPNAGKNPGGVNPDGENPYPAANNVGWATIWQGGAGSAITYSAEQNIPFAFQFNGNAVTKFTAGNFGTVAFNAGTPSVKPTAYSNLSLPNANIPDNSINILGIRPQTNTTYNSAIMTKTYGTAPNRQLWIWFNFFGEANIQSGWTYWAVVLEETTNNIHIVDMKTLCVTAASQLCSNNVKLSAGIQINSTTAYPIAGSPNLGALQITENIFTADDNSYYTFFPGTQPVRDVSATKVNVSPFLIISQAPFSMAGNFRNLGSATVTAADLNYSINGGATVTAAGTGVNIAKYATQALTHPTTWTPAATGNYTIKMWASNINGSPDEKLSNDTITFSVSVVDNFEPRKVLHEVFTSSTCGPCTPGNIQLHKVLDPKPSSEYTIIKYQQNFPGVGDPYFTTEALNRRNYYGVNSIPRLEYDGGWNANPTGYTDALFTSAQSKPSFIKINATHTVDVATKAVAISITVEPLANNPSTNLRLFVGILEKRTEKNVKTNGETEFLHVMKKMVPNENGTVLGALTKGTPVVKNLNWTFKGTYRLPANASSPINNATEHSVEDFNNLQVIAFVQDYSTKEVFQSTYSRDLNAGIKQAMVSESNINLYPNPSNGITQVSFELQNNSHIQIGVYNTLGQLVLPVTASNLESGINAVRFDTKTLAKGVYFVRVEGDNFSSSKKLIVE